MRGGNPTVEQAGLGKNKTAGAIGGEHGAPLMLTAQRDQERLYDLEPGKKALDVGDERTWHDHRIRDRPRVDRAIDGDHLAGGRPHRLAVKRLDPPLQHRFAGAMALPFRPHDIGRGEDVDCAGHARGEDAVIDPDAYERHGTEWPILPVYGQYCHSEFDWRKLADSAGAVWGSCHAGPPAGTVPVVAAAAACRHQR
jgi:hypothetical protein